jgi:WD40 repeat protein
LDGVTTLSGVLAAYGFMLAISLGGALAFLTPAMAVSRGWRIGVALTLLAYIVPVGLHVIWPYRNFFDDDLHLFVIEIGAVPAAVGLFLLGSGLGWPAGRLLPAAGPSPKRLLGVLGARVAHLRLGAARMPSGRDEWAGVALLAWAILTLTVLLSPGVLGSGGSGPGVNEQAYREIGPPLRRGGSGWVVAFSPNGRLLASSDAYGRPVLWDARTHRALGKPFPCNSDPVVFSHDGRIACDGGDFLTRWKFELWNPAPGSARKLVTAFGGSGSVTQIAFSPDGRLLATSDVNGANAVHVWNVRTHHEVGKPLPLSCTAVGQPKLTCEDSGSLAFSPDGRILAAANAAAIRLFDVRTHRPLGNDLVTPSAEPLAGYSFAFQPHGHLLASVDSCGVAEGCDDMKFVLWDVRTQKQVGPALLSCSEPLGLTFRPDGRVIATACGGEIRFWDVRSHKQIGEPLVVSGLSDRSDLAFSPNGRILATASGDETVGGDLTVRLWSVAAVGWGHDRG